MDPRPSFDSKKGLKKSDDSTWDVINKLLLVLSASLERSLSILWYPVIFGETGRQGVVWGLQCPQGLQWKLWGVVCMCAHALLPWVTSSWEVCQECVFTPYRL